jgi:hypothetical protein
VCGGHSRQPRDTPSWSLRIAGSTKTEDSTTGMEARC